MGAWIEIEEEGLKVYLCPVAPPVGAWIEICEAIKENNFTLVAPPVGAWIEIFWISSGSAIQHCRSPRGSVD